MKVLLVSLFLLLPVSIFGQTDRSTSIVIKNVSVIDMTGAASKLKMTVVIDGDRITRIGRSAKVKIPKNVHVIDGTGKFLIPSLWDMHVHVLNSDLMMPLFVANGVLGVRDLGNPQLAEILMWRDQAAAGKIIGPRILTAGKVVDGSPPANEPYSVTVTNESEGRNAVRDLKARGVDTIKVYEGLSREAYLGIADESKKIGLTFVGHTPTVISTIEASDAGQKSIEHLGKVLADCSGDQKLVEAKQKAAIPPNDFFAFTTRLGTIYDAVLSTFSRKKEAEIFEHFRKNGTWQVPTLAIKNGRTFIDELDSKGDPRTKYVEPSQVNYWKPQVGFFSRYRTASYIAAQKRYFEKELRLVGEMQRADVKMMAGTDAPNAYVIAGFGLHDELALMVRSGLTPFQALKTATRNPVEFLGELKDSGTIEKGKLANLILLDANPLVDIRNTTRINAVIQKGRYMSRADLDKMLADVEAAAKNKKN